MYITKLNIYGFGKLIDREINLASSNFQIFYGENEAGKSTLISFINSILFGFPSKLQNENRYEPRIGLKYGGSITIKTEEFGEVTIERIAGKAAGDVTVYLSDGTIHKDAKLNEILYGMDKRVYSSIFSFGLQGLQEVSSIKSEELNHFLFSSSVLGNEQLMEIEKKLAKEMEKLFKPSGKKPELNQNIEELNRIFRQLQEAKGQVEEYRLFIQQELSVQNELEVLLEENEDLKNRFKLLDTFERYSPLKKELDIISYRLKEFGADFDFPIDGVNRLEQLLTHIIPLEAQITSLQEKLNNLDRLQEDILLHEELLEAEEEIVALNQQHTIFQYDTEKLLSLQITFESISHQIKEIQDSYGIKLNKSEIIGLELSHGVKEEIRKYLQTYERLRIQKDSLDNQQERYRQNLELCEEAIVQFENERLEAEEKIELQKKLSQSFSNTENKDKLQLRFKTIQQQISAIKRKETRGKWLLSAFIMPITLLFILFGGWEYYKEGNLLSLILAGSGLILGIGGIVVFTFLKNSYLPILKEEEKELRHLLNGHFDYATISHEDVIEIQTTLAKDEQIVQLLQKENIRLKQLQQEYDRTIDQFDEWERSWHDVCVILSKLKGHLLLDHSFHFDSMLELFDQLKLLRSYNLELKKISQDIQTTQLAKNEFITKYNSLLSSLNLENMSMDVLMSKLEEEKGKKHLYQQYSDRRKEILEETTHLRKEKQFYIEKKNELIALAGVKSEEAFREKGKNSLHLVELKTKHSQLKEQIHFLLRGNKDLEDNLLQLEDVQLDEVEVQKQQISLRVEKNTTRSQELIKRQVELEVQKKQLEEQGIYSTVLQKYEWKRSLLTEQAKKWAKLAIAQDILHLTKNYYRIVRLPEVIEQAQAYFTELTDFEYKKVFAPQEDESFVVERKDGVRFNPRELSQATSEQLYLALRLALAKTYKTNIALPLIIDDSFVNFDEKRFSITTKILKEISNERQVIFFTCHHQIFNIIDEESIYKLKNRLSIH